MNEPESFKALPRYGKYPVPYMFYVSDDGVPNFQMLDGAKIERCYVESLCGLCGGKLGPLTYFVGGPESCKTGTFFDPPAHRECVEHAFEICPYLLGQKDYRTLTNRPANATITAAIPQSPGILRVGIFPTRSYIWGIQNGHHSFFAVKCAPIEWRNRLCL